MVFLEAYPRPGPILRKRHQDENLDLCRPNLGDFVLRRILVARQIHLVEPRYLLHFQIPD